MLKKTVTYTDYDGETRTEDFYFNLNRAEVTEMQLSTEGGMEKMLKKIIDSRDGKRIIEVFKDIVLRAYGEKSGDGKRFVKTQELRDAFEQTEAYVEIFMELATDADAAAAFVKGILPPSEKVSQPASAPALGEAPVG